MTYLLRRHEDGKFVAPPGSPKSYTTSPLRARRFATREEAEADRCGNESIVIFNDWQDWSPLG